MSSQQQIPYQCLKKYETTLIAARGSSIDLFNLEDHLLLSTWKCPSEPEPEPGFSLSVPETSMKPAPQESKSNADIISNTDASTPQAKRRKLSNAAHSPKTSETNGQRKANNRSDAVASGLQAPAVIALAVARGGKHVIAVTGEDKSIRVFEDVSGPNGGHQLQQISQR
jgi:tRNA (guanine-N(7)-)-methyltransferase subunit TRM82